MTNTNECQTIVANYSRGTTADAMRGHVAALLSGCALTVAVVIMAMVAGSPAATNSDPMALVKTTVGQVLDVLKNHSTSQDVRRRELIDTVADRFDFADMARSSLGYHWRELTPAQRDEFVPLFTSFMENAYLNKLEGYAGQRIEFKGETRPEPGYSQVSSTVIQPNGADPIRVDYLLKQENNDWKVSDVTVDNISITTNYRNQFNRVINDQGFNALVNAMKLKQQELTNSLASN